MPQEHIFAFDTYPEEPRDGSSFQDITFATISRQCVRHELHTVAVFLKAARERGRIPEPERVSIVTDLKSIGRALKVTSDRDWARLNALSDQIADTFIKIPSAR